MIQRNVQHIRLEKVPHQSIWRRINPFRWHLVTWFAFFTFFAWAVWANYPRQFSPREIDQSPGDLGATYSIVVHVGWPVSYYFQEYSPLRSKIRHDVNYFAAAQNIGLILLALTSLVVVLQSRPSFSTSDIFWVTLVAAVSIAALTQLYRNGYWIAAFYLGLVIFFFPTSVVVACAIRNILRRATKSRSSGHEGEV